MNIPGKGNQSAANNEKKQDKTKESSPAIESEKKTASLTLDRKNRRKSVLEPRDGKKGVLLARQGSEKKNVSFKNMIAKKKKRRRKKERTTKPP